MTLGPILAWSISGYLALGLISSRMYYVHRWNKIMRQKKYRIPVAKMKHYWDHRSDDQKCCNNGKDPVAAIWKKHEVETNGGALATFLGGPLFLLVMFVLMCTYVCMNLGGWMQNGLIKFWQHGLSADDL